MRVLIWIEGTWEGCVDAARAVLPADAEVDLLHVTAGEVAEAAEGAAHRLGRPAGRLRRRGAAERLVVEAAGADLLVLARDGDRSRPGPRSLGPATRFVVDHAPCVVLLAWPAPAPDLSSIPPPPAHPPLPPGGP